MARVKPFYDLSASIHTEEIVAQIAAATEDALARGGQHQERLVEYLKSASQDKGAITRINQELAVGMREAVVEAYNTNVIGKRASPRYTGNTHRYGGGALGRALGSVTMAVGDAEGIKFINTALLDSSAAQWARLNFGAEPNIGNTVGASSPRTGRIRFGGGEGKSIRLIEGPGAPFNVPESGKGFFNNKNQLIMGKTSAKGDEVQWVHAKPSLKGIGARRFLDAGLVSLGDNFGKAWKQFFVDAKREAVDRIRREKVEAGGRDFQAIYARRKANPNSQYFRG